MAKGAKQIRSQKRKSSAESAFRLQPGAIISDFVSEKVPVRGQNPRKIPLGEFIAKLYMAKAKRGEKNGVRNWIKLREFSKELDEISPVVVEISADDAGLL